MRIAVLSDIHSNMEALESVLHIVDKENIDCIVCLGDLVGYGPEPDECIHRILGTADRIIAGNHDCAATGRTSTEDFNVHAKQAARWTEKMLTDESRDRLRELPLTDVEQDVLLVHATPDAPDRWHYLLGIGDVERSFNAMSHDVCFTGHSHVPGVFVRNPGGGIEFQDASDLTLRPGHAYIINVGSVGQPRDGDPRACFGIYDAEEKRFRLARVGYPIGKVQAKMQNRGLPRFLIDRLSLGR